MSIYIDTSASFALMDSGDEFHGEAKKFFLELINSREIFHSSNYVLIENIVLIQNRLGLDALTVFQDNIVPIINIHCIDEKIHNIAINSLLISRRKDISFIDYTSFELMRSLGIEKVFTFDGHFNERGFKALP